MDKREVATKIVFEVIDELNSDEECSVKVEKKMDAVLIGHLESLQVINLLTETEEKMCDELNFSGSLSENENILSSDGPLASVETLINYIVEIA